MCEGLLLVFQLNVLSLLLQNVSAFQKVGHLSGYSVLRVDNDVLSVKRLPVFNFKAKSDKYNCG
jgi:hypothetical protein